MKVYLRHVKTKLYYSGWANWTGEVQRAVNFERPQDAIQRARSDMLGHMEVVIQDGDPVRERVVPVVEPGA
jgi:hypothetical protein